ncbi:F-actin-capping protein subunit beta [Orbilia oligospora]|uniref:F-actin-capping protein subunit beta n=1 Tax=Orbilia oligospora TaxID=2813651 RepID=A0A7C8U971_ORBOL|nr:F-actin-capping protein subunit beta [Orbilia oligospora]
MDYILNTLRSIRLPARYYSLVVPAIATVIVLTILFNIIDSHINAFVPLPKFLSKSKQRELPKTRGDNILYGGHFFPHREWMVPRHLDKFEKLFLDSYLEYRAFLDRQSRTYADAVKNYKKRYNRSPPPGFDKWFSYAQTKASLVIDDYDSIEESIAPYRNMPQKEFLHRMEELRVYDNVFRIAEYKVIERNELMKGQGLWHLLDWDFFYDLPEGFLMYINTWDEPFVFPQELNRTQKIEFFDLGRKPWWPALLEHCNVWEGRNSKYVRKNDRHDYIATIQDAKEALDLCAHPEYEGMHGFFNAPSSLMVTKQLVPIFSVSKLSVFKDLLLPSAAPWHPEFLGNGGIKDFVGKIKKLYWRGSATGGDNNGDNVLKSHRSRLASISQEHPDLIDAKVTTYFGDLEGLQQQWREFGEPERTDHGAENNFSFLMDMDGHGLSGRYYRLLRSKAVVFKSTAVQQWHDDRMFPWVHYIPIRLGMKELAETVKWFATTERGDEIGRRIAEEADWWSRTGVREDDANVYTYRLFLEYAALFVEPRPN